jgi:hypothetical protein
MHKKAWWFLVIVNKLLVVINKNRLENAVICAECVDTTAFADGGFRRVLKKLSNCSLTFFY